IRDPLVTEFRRVLFRSDLLAGVNKGFTDSVARGAIEVVSTKYGDTGKEIQLKLVEDVLQAYPNIDYIVGTSPTTEAAAQALRDEIGRASWRERRSGWMG